VTKVVIDYQNSKTEVMHSYRAKETQTNDKSHN